MNLALFVHVLGAMVLVGGLVAATGALGLARRDASLLRLGYWSLLAVALPGWVTMRIGAQWVHSEAGWDDLPEGAEEPTWLEIGWIVGDLGGAIILVSLILGGIGVRRLRQGKGTALLGTTLVLSLVALAAYVVTAWAMAGKPA